MMAGACFRIPFFFEFTYSTTATGKMSVCSCSPSAYTLGWKQHFRPSTVYRSTKKHCLMSKRIVDTGVSENCTGSKLQNYTLVSVEPTTPTMQGRT